MVELVTQTLLGGVTGYVTNNMAISMLFKEYFGFGGVIKKEYKEFIKNISELVERDLINEETILPYIKDEKFQELLVEMIEDIITIRLIQKHNSLNIIDLDGFNESFDNLITFAKENQAILLKNIYLNELISKNQFDVVSNNLSIFLSKRKFEINEFLYDSLKDKKISQLIGNDIKIIKSNIFEIIDNATFEIEKFSSIIDTKRIVDAILDEIGYLKVGDIVNEERLLKIILRVIKNDDVIDKFSKEIIEYLKGVNKTIRELIDDGVYEYFKSKLKSLIINNFENVKDLIEANRYEIESRIDRVVDSYLDSGVVNKILKIIKNAFIGSVSKRYDIVAKIINAIEDYKGYTVEEMADEVDRFLEEYKVSDIVYMLEKNNILDSKKLASILKKSIQELEKLNIDLDFVKDKRINELITLNYDSFIDKIDEFVDNKVREFAKSDKFKKILKDLISSKLDKIENKKIGELFSEFSFDIDIKFDFYDELSTLNLEKISINYFSLKEMLDIPLTSIYKKADSNIYIHIKNGIIFVIEHNLEDILKGNVSEIVNKELSKLSPDEINSMVQNFMGKELKPINYLGAGLGAIAGGGYYMATFSIANPLLVYATPLIYGVTGIFTNYIAIKMLFRPYEKKAYLPVFSPGVVAKNKAKFAKNISVFIKDNILKDEALKNSFASSKETIKGYSIEIIRKNDYEVIDRILKKDSEIIVSFFKDGIFNILEKHKEKISNKVVNYLKEYEIDANLVSDLIIENSDKINSSILFDSIKDKKVLVDAINKFISQNRYEIVESLSSMISFNKVKELSIEYEDSFEKFKQNKISSLISDDAISSIVKIIYSYIENNLIQTKAISEYIVNTFSKEEFNPNKRLSELFDGKLATYLRGYIIPLLDMLIKKAKELKSDVKEEAISNLPFGTGWFLKDKVSDIIDIIFDEELPDFVYSKEKEVETLLMKFLNYRLKDFGIDEHTLDGDKINSIIENLFNQIGEHFIKIVVVSLFELKVEDILSATKIKNLNSIFKVFEEPIKAGISSLQNEIENNSQQVIKVISQNISNNLSNVYIKDLIKGINEERVFNNLKDSILNNQNLKPFLNELISDFLATKFYDEEILKKDIEEFISVKLKTHSDEITEILNNLIFNLNSILDTKLKDKLSTDIVDVVFDEIENKIVKILQVIDIKELIEKEINAMHPKEIEDMFYSFAGSYFKKLIVYGGFGAIFGIGGVFF